MTPHDLAPAIYAGYAEDRDWTTDRGDRMPLWDGLTFGERSHWLAAADTVLDRLTPTPAIEHLRDRLTEPDDPPGLREIAAAVVELADMLRARRPAP